MDISNQYPDFTVFFTNGGDPVFPNGFPSSEELNKRASLDVSLGIVPEIPVSVQKWEKNSTVRTENNPLFSFTEQHPNYFFGIHIAEIDI